MVRVTCAWPLLDLLDLHSPCYIRMALIVYGMLSPHVYASSLLQAR